MNSTRLRELSALLLIALCVGGTPVAHSQTPGASVDVVGIKLGMPMPAAVAAVRADNAKLGMQNDTLQLEGFGQPFVTSVVADQAGEAGKDKEQIQLLITTPPHAQVVWGIRRVYTYSDQTRPSLDNTLAGLRKKYGPETVFVNPDPRDMTKNMVWVYDLSGKLLSSGQGRPIYIACDSYLGTHFGSGTAIQNDLSGMKSPSPQCDSVILATASVQANRSASDGTTVVNNLIFQVSNGALYHESIGATRAVATGAAAAREQKQSEKVDQRGAPKL